MKKCIIGVDVGSVFTKAAVMDGSGLLFFHVVPSGGNYRSAIEKVIEESLDKTGLSRDLTTVASTGCGSSLVPFSSSRLPEIACLSRGINYFFPSANTVFEVSGQASRVVRVKEGKPISVAVTERCAAGSGRFIQIIAKVLGIEFNEVGELSLQARNPVSFTTGCAVFTETETISRIAEGAAKGDILAGLHEVMVAKILSLLERVGLAEDLAVAGGGAKDSGLVSLLEQRLARKILAPEEPLVCSAVGAALIAREEQGG
jgi:predicted CoA-substrate-specific enzyme activase